MKQTKKTNVILLKNGIKRVINQDTPWWPLGRLWGLCGRKNKTTNGTENLQRARRKVLW